MRDVVDNYRRLVGEFLTSDTLEERIEAAGYRLAREAWRLGRRILPKSRPVEIPHADGVADASEFWSLVQRDIFEQQNEALARYMDAIYASSPTPADSPLVKRAEEKRDVYEEVLRAASTIDWKNPVTADQAARDEAVAKVRAAYNAGVALPAPDLEHIIGTIGGVPIVEHPDGTERP